MLGQARCELTLQVNFLAGALLTNLLLPALRGPTARIINVASATHYAATLDVNDLAFDRRRYSATDAYAESKLAVVTYSCWLGDRIEPTVVSVHPGVISTALLHSMFGTGGAPVDGGGANLTAAIDVAVPTGTYLDERRPTQPNPQALDPEVQRRLRDAAAELASYELI